MARADPFIAEVTLPSGVRAVGVVRREHIVLVVATAERVQLCTTQQQWMTPDRARLLAADITAALDRIAAPQSYAP